jgi:hypothetical protein
VLIHLKLFYLKLTAYCFLWFLTFYKLHKIYKIPNIFLSSTIHKTSTVIRICILSWMILNAKTDGTFQMNTSHLQLQFPQTGPPLLYSLNHDFTEYIRYHKRKGFAGKDRVCNAYWSIDTLLTATLLSFLQLLTTTVYFGDRLGTSEKVSGFCIHISFFYVLFDL